MGSFLDMKVRNITYQLFSICLEISCYGVRLNILIHSVYGQCSFSFVCRFGLPLNLGERFPRGLPRLFRISMIL